MAPQGGSTRPIAYDRHVPKLPVAGTELHYERAGDGEPLLLIQGMSGTHLAWGRPFGSLLERSFDCVAFDNRGIGLSGPAEEPFTIAEMAADALGLLDALEVERAHVLGISMGGMIAQELALAHPGRVRSLAIGCSYCGGPGSQLMDPTDFQVLAAALASGDRERVYRAMWELNLSPGFRADESRYAEFHEMASALPVARRTVELRAAGDRRPRHQRPAAGADRADPGPARDRRPHPRRRQRPPDRLARPRLQAQDLRADRVDLFWWEHPERAAELVRRHALAETGS